MKHALLVGTLLGFLVQPGLAVGQPVESRSPVPSSLPSQLAGFSVVLVLGDRQEHQASADPLPADASRALDDVRALLPFKSYRMVDAQWTLGADRAPMKLRGPEGRLYAFLLKASLLVPGRVAVSLCRLWELAPQNSRSTLPSGLAGSGGQPDAPALIDTSFGMKVGETVVVGTSEFQGSGALVILLTAKAVSAQE